MSFQQGYAAGISLDDRVTAREAIRNQLELQHEGEMSRLRQRLVPHERKEERQRLRLERLETLIGRLRSDRQQLDELRDTMPSEFSLVKGILYLLLSICLILADIALLGQVTARFLNYRIYEGGGKREFWEVLFSDPAEALTLFPHLLFLVMSVLLMGLFLKVWRDVEDVYCSLPETRRRRERILFGLLLMLALLSVILMSAARLTMSFGNEETLQEVSPISSWSFPSVVACILGLSLPLVSAGFFVRGYESIEKRYRLFRVSRRLQLNEWWYRAQSERQERLLGEIEALRAEVSPAGTSELIDKRIADLQREFDRGYRDGLAGLLASPDLAETLRPFAMRRAIGLDLP
jgi:hypothetical protein